MKKIKLSVLFFVIALFLSSCIDGKGDTVATVGNEEITSEELKFVMLEVSGNEKEEIKEQSLDYLIEQTLFYIDAKANDITVSDNEVEARLSSLYSKDKLNDLKKNYDISEKTIKKLVKKQILYQKYVIDVLKNKDDYIPSEEKLLDEFYKNYFKVQHILIKADSSDENKMQDAHKRIKRIYDKITPRTDFNELSAENSEDDGIICLPGEEIIFKGSDMEEWFYETVNNIPVGEVSDIVESQYGYHIIKRLPLTEFDVADRETELINEHKTSYMEKLVDDLKTEYKITKNNDKLKQIAVSTGF